MKNKIFTIILLHIIILCFYTLIFAQEPFVSETWQVKATKGHYDKRQKFPPNFSFLHPILSKLMR